MRIKLLQRGARLRMLKKSSPTWSKEYVNPTPEITHEEPYINTSPQLVDLHRSPVSLEEEDKGDEAMLKGILGSIVGQSATDQKARLDAVSQSATDLSSLVRRKPAKPAQQSSKRPAEDDAPADEGSKRARVDDDA